MMLSLLLFVLMLVTVQLIFSTKAEAKIAQIVEDETAVNPELQLDINEVEEVLGGKIGDFITIEEIKDSSEIAKFTETDRKAYYPATQNYKAVEILLRQGGFFKEVMQILEKRHNPEKPQAALLSRIAHAHYETGIQVEDKKEARELFKKGIKYIEPYIDTATGTTGERTYLIYWYGLNKIMYYQYKYGLFALFTIDSVMKIVDRAIAEDPRFPQTYYLKAHMYENVPFGKWGDKFKMVQNYAKAYEVANAGKLHIGNAFAKALVKRNWDVDRKGKEAQKRKVESDGTPMNLSDQEYAVEISKFIIELYYSRPDVYRADRYGLMCKEAEEIVEKFGRA